MATGSPLLDDYDRSGVVTPALQRALDMARQTIGANAGLSPVAAPAGPAPRLTPSPSPAPALSPAMSSAPPVSLLGGEARPESQQMPVPKPMTAPEEHQQRLTDVTTGEGAKSGVARIKNPWLRTPLQVLSAIGDAFVPGITQHIPGGELHHQGLVSMARANVNQDQAQATAEATRAHTQAEATELAARGEHERASGKLAEQQATTLAAEGKRAPKGNYIAAGTGLFNAETGEWVKEPADKHDVYEISEEKGKALGLQPNAKGEYLIPKEAVGPMLTQELKPAPKPTDQENFVQKYLTEHNLADNATNREKALKAHSTAAQAPQRDPQFPMLVPDGQGGYTTTVLRGEGQHVAPGAVTPSTASAQSAPTTQMRNVAAQAQLVHEQTPHMLSEIDRLKDKLGPVTGRWNEFMQGHVGMDDPDMAGLRADLLMYSSAVALMHARGRLPENLREEFDRAINAPRQSPENLKAVIGRIDQWTAKNQLMGGHVTPGAGGQTPTVTTKAEFDALPSGAVYLEDGKRFKKP